MPLRFAHANVPDHLVTVDAVSERKWVVAQCSCGADFSRRKWTRSAELIVEDIETHFGEFAPREHETEEEVAEAVIAEYMETRKPGGSTR